MRWVRFHLKCGSPTLQNTDLTTLPHIWQPPRFSVFIINTDSPYIIASSINQLSSTHCRLLVNKSVPLLCRKTWRDRSSPLSPYRIMSDMKWYEMKSIIKDMYQVSEVVAMHSISILIVMTGQEQGPAFYAVCYSSLTLYFQVVKP